MTAMLPPNPLFRLFGAHGLQARGGVPIPSLVDQAHPAIPRPAPSSQPAQEIAGAIHGLFPTPTALVAQAANHVPPGQAVEAALAALLGRPDTLANHPMPHEPETLFHNPQQKRRSQAMSPLARAAAGY